MNDNVKTLIMCHLEGHWIPFKDVDSCKDYLLRLKNDFNFFSERDFTKKVRVFKADFTEITLNFEENE